MMHYLVEAAEHIAIAMEIIRKDYERKNRIISELQYENELLLREVTKGGADGE